LSEPPEPVLTPSLTTVVRKLARDVNALQKLATYTNVLKDDETALLKSILSNRVDSMISRLKAIKVILNDGN
jgi:hypothetical protein